MNAPFQLSAGNGVVVGVVTRVDDPLGLHRVQVRLPHLGGEVTPWARLASPMAGKDYGFVMRPEVEDEVLVVYEQGDPRRAYVIGALWSNVDKPPNGTSDPSNHHRLVHSRSGHVIKLDDTPGKERIEVISSDKAHKFVMDVSGKQIELTTESGKITIKASQGDVNIEAPAARVAVKAQEVSVEATGEAEIKATSLKLNASADLSIEAGGMLSLKGSQISLN